MKKFNKIIELPTLGLILLTYTAWTALVTQGHNLPILLWVVLFALNLTLFLSVNHEVIHGHPTRNATVNRLLLLFPLGWVFPYERFRDTHMQHHKTDELTDPFDDPESWYYPKLAYEEMNAIIRATLTFNNTLFGRMLIGPIISVSKFYISEIIQIATDKHMRWYLVRVWSLHFALVAMLVSFIISYSAVSIWSYFIASYLGLSVLLIRTYLEHQASEGHAERTVIIEKCCPLAFLFLYNNLHAVHHEKPGIPWYELPDFYRTNSHWLKQLNNHYIYASYGEVFQKYFFTPKEAIPHPFLRGGNLNGQ